MAWLLELITTNAARAIGIEGYGLAEGCRADLVVLDARDSAQAITEQAEKLYVIKNGRVVARNRRTTELLLSCRPQRAKSNSVVLPPQITTPTRSPAAG
jgi:cytosine deaminase